MAIEVVERWNSRQQVFADQFSETVEYIINGTDDDSAALLALLSFAPTIWPTLVPAVFMPRTSAEITERLAQFIYAGVVQYGTNIPAEGEELLSFDTSGGTTKMTLSLGTQIFPAPGITPPTNHHGAIGVENGNVEGVNIQIPALTFSKIRRFPASFVTSTYVKTLARLSGSVNDAPFFGFDADEVQFKGASGSQRNPNEKWDIVFKFDASENAVGLTLGEITGIAKKGWNYLWVQYQDQEDTSANALSKRALAAYVETVLPRGNFALLGLRTGP